MYLSGLVLEIWKTGVSNGILLGMTHPHEPKTRFSIASSITVIVFGLAFFIGIISDVFFPIRVLPSFVITILGPVLFFIGSIAVVWTGLAGRKLSKHIKSGKCVEHIHLSHGPYMFSRNPLYLALFMLQIGYGFATNSVMIALAGILALTLAEFFLVGKEEAILRERFKDAYDAYTKFVDRWM